MIAAKVFAHRSFYASEARPVVGGSTGEAACGKVAGGSGRDGIAAAIGARLFQSVQSIEALERRLAEMFLLATLLCRSISSKVAQNSRLQ